MLTGFVNSRETEGTACGTDQGNQGCEIREEPLEPGREKVSRLGQHFNYGVNCG